MVTERVEPATLGVMAPPLVLQPLAENAVERGVSRLVGVRGESAVSACVVAAPAGARRLVLTVADNGPRPDPAPAARADGAPGGVGPANTHDRLRTLYGDAAALSLTPGPDGGAVATV